MLTFTNLPEPVTLFAVDERGFVYTVASHDLPELLNRILAGIEEEERRDLLEPFLYDDEPEEGPPDVGITNADFFDFTPYRGR
jgi:hypothetical protein